MTLHSYLPILTKTTKQAFLNYIHALHVPEINYFAIGIQNILTKESTSLMSSHEWQQYFIENECALYDPIRKITLSTKRNIIPFSEIDFLDNMGKEIMKKRAKMGIKNGVIFMTRLEKYNYILTLGTDFSNFNAFNFTKQYYDSVCHIKQDFIQLIMTDSKRFLKRTLS